MAAGQQPSEEALNQHRLAALLGEPDLDEKGQVRTWATEVRPKLPDADLKHLQNIATLHAERRLCCWNANWSRTNAPIFAMTCSEHGPLALVVPELAGRSDQAADEADDQGDNPSGQG